jgi:hypothetical protein
MCDNEGVYRRLIAAKNNSKYIKRRAFLWCRLLQTPGARICKEKKDDNPLVIGKNYINKMFLFFNILFMDVFTYR